jgi:membrane-associated phospholipid phosphatase
MSARLGPFLLAAIVTGLVFAAVSMTPRFAGDVTVARAVQAISPGTDWAVAMTQTALPPIKYAVMVLAVGLAMALAGWKGAALVIVALVVEQTGGEASKLIAGRPRPSRDLIAVVGNPSGFSFPSTFTTFYAVTFGTLLLVARRTPATALATAVAAGSAALIVLGWAARVVPGAHWPSDVVLTTLVCLVWLWAAIRAVLPRA